MATWLKPVGRRVPGDNEVRQAGAERNTSGWLLELVSAVAFIAVLITGWLVATTMPVHRSDCPANQAAQTGWSAAVGVAGVLGCMGGLAWVVTRPEARRAKWWRPFVATVGSCVGFGLTIMVSRQFQNLHAPCSSPNVPRSVSFLIDAPILITLVVGLILIRAIWGVCFVVAAMAFGLAAEFTGALPSALHYVRTPHMNPRNVDGTTWNAAAIFLLAVVYGTAVLVAGVLSYRVRDADPESGSRAKVGEPGRYLLGLFPVAMVVRAIVHALRLSGYPIGPISGTVLSMFAAGLMLVFVGGYSEYSRVVRAEHLPSVAAVVGTRLQTAFINNWARLRYGRASAERRAVAAQACGKSMLAFDDRAGRDRDTA